MNNPYDHAHALARSIRSSKVYQELKQAKQEVKSNPTFQEMLDSLQQKQHEFHELMIQGKQPTSSEVQQYQTLMQAVQGIPTLTKYLQAEERFGLLLNDIQRILMEPVEDLVGKKE